MYDKKVSSTGGSHELFISTIGVMRAEVKIGMANSAYDLTQFVWHRGPDMPA